jgi:hypothetical protein
MKQIDVLVPEPLVVMMDELSRRMGIDRDNLICLAIYEKMNREGLRARHGDAVAAKWKTKGDGSDAPYYSSL